MRIMLIGYDRLLRVNNVIHGRKTQATLAQEASANTQVIVNTFLLITRAPGHLQRRFLDQTKAQSVI